MRSYSTTRQTWAQAARITAVMIAGVAAILFHPLPLQAQTEQHRLITTFSYIPLEDAGCPLVQVKLVDKNHTGTFLLDTGTAFTAVTDAMAAKLNLIPKPFFADGKPFLVDGKPMDAVHLAAFQFGQLPLAGDAVVLRAQSLAKALGTPVDGILGVNCFEKSAILFDFSKHEITVWFPGNLTNTEVQGAGFNEAAVALMEGLGENKGKFTTEIKCGSGPNRGRDSFVIDTGADHSRVSYPLAQQLKLVPLQSHSSHVPTLSGPVSYNTLSDTVNYNTALLETLQLGQFTIANHLIAYPDQPKPSQYSPSSLGMDKLLRFRVLIDFPAKKMYLQPVAPLSAPADPAPVPAEPATQSPPTTPPAK